jgi:hypothetical protein
MLDHVVPGHAVCNKFGTSPTLLRQVEARPLSGVQRLYNHVFCVVPVRRSVNSHNVYALPRTHVKHRSRIHRVEMIAWFVKPRLLLPCPPTTTAAATAPLLYTLTHPLPSTAGPSTAAAAVAAAAGNSCQQEWLALTADTDMLQPGCSSHHLRLAHSIHHRLWLTIALGPPAHIQMATFSTQKKLSDVRLSPVQTAASERVLLSMCRMAGRPQDTDNV